jgi:hypothetical protein
MPETCSGSGKELPPFTPLPEMAQAFFEKN